MLNTRPTISIVCSIRGCHSNLRFVWGGEGLPPLTWYALKKAETLAKGWTKMGPSTWICPGHSGNRP